MKQFIFLPFLLFTMSQQTTGKGFYYCLDHAEKKIYYSTGDVTIKKGLEKDEFYQYGFMKRMGWINRTWQGLEYKLRLYPKASFPAAARQSSDSLIRIYVEKGYSVENMPMPYPMKPYSSYKKDGTN